MATIQFPLQIATVNIANSNAFWSQFDGSNYDWGHVRYQSASAGKVTYWGIVPKNLAGTPAWNVLIHHSVSAGSGGQVAYTLKALDFADNATRDSALTALVTSGTASANASGKTTITTVSGSNFDATEAIAAGNLIIIELTREGADAGDTISTTWFVDSLVMQCDVS